MESGLDQFVYESAKTKAGQVIKNHMCCLAHKVIASYYTGIYQQRVVPNNNHGVYLENLYLLIMIPIDFWLLQCQ